MGTLFRFVCATHLWVADYFVHYLRDDALLSVCSLLRSVRFLSVSWPPFLSVITFPKLSYRIIPRVMCLLIINLLCGSVVADVFLQGELHARRREGVTHGRALGELHVYSLDSVDSCFPRFCGGIAAVSLILRRNEPRSPRRTLLPF